MTYLARESSHPEVYAITGNQKFWIPTPSALFAMGYTWNDVQVVPDGSLANLVTIKADSLAATPPSLVFPPDNQSKWYAVTLPTSKQVTSRGSLVSLVELRGWLRMVSGGCNSSDPDWHYYLEVDPEWCDSQGIDMHRLITVGTILAIGAPYDPVSTAYATVCTPCVQMELTGWPDTHHSYQAKPQDWNTINAAGCPQVTWAFDPLHPNPSDPSLPVSASDNAVFDPVPGSSNPQAPYVKVTGSLVTDEPHTTESEVFTWLAREFNIVRSSEDEARAVRQAWDYRAPTDPNNVARWTELHPPDGIWMLGTKTPRYTHKGVAVFARNGLFAGDQQALDVDIYPPGPQPSGMRAAVQENVGPETNFSTIIEGNASKSGAALTLYPDHVHVHVKVQGQAAWGAPGKFKALYRVYWEPIPPKTKEKETEKVKREKEKEKERDHLPSPYGSAQNLPQGDAGTAQGQPFIKPDERPSDGGRALAQPDGS